MLLFTSMFGVQVTRRHVDNKGHSPRPFFFKSHSSVYIWLSTSYTESCSLLVTKRLSLSLINVVDEGREVTHWCFLASLWKYKLYHSLLQDLFAWRDLIPDHELKVSWGTNSWGRTQSHSTVHLPHGFLQWYNKTERVWLSELSTDDFFYQLLNWLF